MMTINSPKLGKVARIYTKKALKKAPAQHFAMGLAKTTAGSSFLDIAFHHKIPDIALIVSDASIIQVVTTVSWLMHEITL